MMCAIMNKLRAINAAARHRLVLDLRMCWIGPPRRDDDRWPAGDAKIRWLSHVSQRARPARRSPGAGGRSRSTLSTRPDVPFASDISNSRLTHPLFTELANLR